MDDSKYVGTCPVCHGAVGRREDGTLFPHQRYADGAGYAPGQPHTFIVCAGSGTGADGEDF